MNDKIFNEQWAILKNAFPANSLAYTPESQRIYRNDLKEIPDALFVRGCARVRKMVELLESDRNAHWLIWHDLEAERRAIKQAWPEAVEVYGTQELEEREQRVIDFSDGNVKYLATKPILSGSGCNFQRHCHKAIFLGVGYATSAGSTSSTSRNGARGFAGVFTG